MHDDEINANSAKISAGNGRTSTINIKPEIEVLKTNEYTEMKRNLAITGDTCKGQQILPNRYFCLWLNFFLSVLFIFYLFIYLFFLFLF